MLWFIIGIVLVLIIALILSMVHLHIAFTRKEHDERLIISIKALYGLFRYRYIIPVIEFKPNQGGIRVENHKENETGSTPPTARNGIMDINAEVVSDFYSRAKDLLKHTFDLIGWLKEVLKRVRCTEFRWDSHIGLGDAPDTAITTGVVWGLKSSLLSILFAHIQLKAQPYISVNPLYNQSQFSTELKCILKIRLGYAIKAGWLLLIRIIKVKGGIRTWQNIRSKA